MRVKVSKKTGQLLMAGKLVDSGTGEVHTYVPYASGMRLRFVSGSYVRVSKAVSGTPEAAYAVCFLGKYPDGVVPKGTDRTSRWRLAELRKKGYAVKLEDGTHLIDPNKFSCKGYPEHKLPNEFK